MKSPSANEIPTQRNANANVHTKTRRNGSRTSGLWMILSKFRNPTAVFQPGSSSSPSFATNEPRPLSAKTVPFETRTNWSLTGSYRSVGASSLALSRPSGRIAASPSVGTVKFESSRSIAANSVPLIVV
jgi:hypothetical protein